jgi:hypothetical protein
MLDAVRRREDIRLEHCGSVTNFLFRRQWTFWLSIAGCDFGFSRIIMMPASTSPTSSWTNAVSSSTVTDETPCEVIASSRTLLAAVDPVHRLKRIAHLHSRLAFSHLDQKQMCDEMSLRSHRIDVRKIVGAASAFGLAVMTLYGTCMKLVALRS